MVSDDPVDAASVARPSPIFVQAIVALNAMTVGLVLPVLPKLVLSMNGGDLAQAGAVVAAFAIIFAAVQFAVSPLHGALSDRLGRRPVLLASGFGLAIDYAIMAVSPTLAWLFAGRIVSAVAAGSTSVVYSYVADVTSNAERARAFGLLGAAAGLGGVAGPLLGGLLGEIDVRLPFVVASALSFAASAAGLAVLRESLTASRRVKRLVWSQVNPLTAAFRFCREHRNMAGFLSATLLFYMSLAGVTTLLALYTTARYGWSPGQNGLLLAALGLGEALAQAFLVAPLERRFGAVRVAIGGIGLRVVGTALLGLAPTGAVVLMAVPLLCIGGVGTPAMLGLASGSVAGNEQGRLHGVLRGVSSLAGVLGPVILGALFATGAELGGLATGAPMYAAVLISGAGLLVLGRWAAAVGGRAKLMDRSGEGG